MQYETKQLMKDDCLTICRLLSIDLFQSKFIKLLMWHGGIILILMVLTQAYLFLDNFEIYYFIRYAPGYVGSFYFLLCMISLPEILKISLSLLQNPPKWKIDSADKKTEKRIIKESRQVTAFVILNAAAVIISGFTFVFPKDVDRNIVYYIMIFEKYFPELETFLLLVFKMFYPLIGFIIMAIPCLQIVYGFTHLKFQFYMFLFYVRNINQGYEDFNERNLFYDKTYQNEIKKRLVFCLMRYRELYEPTQKSLKLMEKYVYPFKVCALLFLTGCLFFCFSFSSILVHLYARIISSAIAACLTGFCLLHFGQEAEDVSSDVFDTLFNVKWYHWNNKNKQLYRMFLSMAAKPFRIKYSENISLNYKLGIELAKTVFSMASVLNQLNGGQLH